MTDEIIRGKWLGVRPAPGDALVIGDAEGVVAVHAVLLHTGKVLMWNSRYENRELLYAAWTWDPKTGSASEELPFNGLDATGPWESDNDIDIFCAHHVVLEDGRVMVIGGASGAGVEGGSHGAYGVWIFDCEKGDDGEWLRIARMLHGRWYPTPVLMGDGSVIVFSGWEAAGLNGTSRRVIGGHDRLKPPSYQPRVIDGGERALFLFPGMHLVKGGRVIHIQTSWRYTFGFADLVPTSVFELDPDGKGQWFVIHDDTGQPVYPEVRFREEGTSVLLPPASEGRIMVLGGGLLVNGVQHADARPKSWEILETLEADGTQTAPRWAYRGILTAPRINVNAVLLPDGIVFICGGHNGNKFDHPESGRAMNAELFDPVSAMADPTGYQAVETDPMGASRMYHSTGILLPDGSVLVAGGLDRNLREPDTQPAFNNNRNLEVYQPPYFFKGQRPKILVTEAKIGYGDTFEVTYEAVSPITSVVLMRPNSMTHHTDSGQRHIQLEHVVKGGKLQVTMEVDNSIAPPGYYMLFLVDEDGRPCEEASFIRLLPETE